MRAREAYKVARIQHQYITEGRRLAKGISQHQWALGDLATKVLRDGSSLAEFAYEIEVDPVTLRRYQSTAQIWPKSKRRLNLPFSVHAELNAYEDPVGILSDLVARYERVTVDVVRDWLGKVPTRPSQADRATVQDEAESVRAALRDPAVLREIATDPAFAPRLTKALLDPDTLLERQHTEVARLREADFAREGVARITRPISQAVEDTFFVDPFISLSQWLNRFNEDNLIASQRQLDQAVKALRQIVTEVEVVAARLSLDVDLASIREGTHRLEE